MHGTDPFKQLPKDDVKPPAKLKSKVVGSYLFIKTIVKMVELSVGHFLGTVSTLVKIADDSMNTEGSPKDNSKNKDTNDGERPPSQ